jgi:hypothetical protein
MKNKIKNNTIRTLLCLTLLIATAGRAHASLINFDFTAGSDSYTSGSAVFGDASSQWNVAGRFSNHINLALFDDTGAASSVTVTTGRLNSASNSGISLADTFASLGTSFQTSTLVTLAGLFPLASYDLVVFFSVQSGSMNQLVEGTNYTLSSGLTANAGGIITFTPTGRNPGFDAGNEFTAFQLRTTPSVVPAPSTLAIFALGLMGLASRRFMKKS